MTTTKRTISHPGEIISDILLRRQISPRRFAAQAGIDAQAFMNFIRCKRRADGPTMNAIEEHLGMSALFIITRQRLHEEALAREQEDVARLFPRLSAFKRLHEEALAREQEEDARNETSGD